MAEEMKRLWCRLCERYVRAVRPKPNRWAHGAMTLVTGGLWGAVWAAREVTRDVKNAIVAGWACPDCGSTALQEKAWQRSSSAASQDPTSDKGSPGRFKVIGVDRNSAEDVELVVDAATPQNARVKAELKGLVVTDVQIIVPSEDLQRETETRQSNFRIVGNLQDSGGKIDVVVKANDREAARAEAKTRGIQIIELTRVVKRHGRWKVLPE